MAFFLGGYILLLIAAVSLEYIENTTTKQKKKSYHVLWTRMKAWVTFMSYTADTHNKFMGLALHQRVISLPPAAAWQQREKKSHFGL